MQDADAEFAIGVDVGVVEGAVELEGRRGIGVVVGEGHGGLEVAAVVEGGRVDDHEGDGPVCDVLVDELGGVGKFFECFDRLGPSLRDVVALTSTLTHFSCERVLYSFMRIRSAMVKECCSQRVCFEGNVV